MRVFVDTGIFIALLIKSERWHNKAVEKYQEYVRRQALFYTNVLVIAELYTRLIYDFKISDCIRAIKYIDALHKEHNIRIFQLDSILFMQSQKAMIRFAEHKLSFTDASIYTFAKSYDIDEIFTLDSDFKKIGLSVSP